MQTNSFFKNQALTSEEANVFLPSVSPELENKISNIINRMQHTNQASTTQKSSHKKRTSITEVLQDGPFTRSLPLQFNSLVKHNNLLFQSNFFSTDFE